MLPFATEFPVKASENRASFVSEVIAWLQGTTYSSVLSSGSERDLDGTNALLRSTAGEELRFRELKIGDDWIAIGFRHDFPDEEGRLWRTEGVLRRAAGKGEQDLVRLRTQCLATVAGAPLESPRKPYLIKALLKNGWGGSDGLLRVSDQPVWLGDVDKNLVSASAITLGQGTSALPTVYVSAVGNGRWLLSKREIEKLAYDLGGVAHVVVEPDRLFSFELRDETEGQNAYGGTVALCMPGRGVVRRYYLGWQLQDAKELAAAVRLAAVSLRAQMPTRGWDWTELQEQALRYQREREKNRLTNEESEQLYVQEIANLQDKIAQLNQQVTARANETVGTDEAEFSLENLVRRIGPEIYAGEISDRLRLAANVALSFADQTGLDKRSTVVLQRIVDRLPISPAHGELSQDIARATKDPKRVASELTALLRRHGYREKSDNKHIRLEADAGFDGLDSITLPKTPSENRGLRNLSKQVERTLGLTKLTG